MENRSYYKKLFPLLIDYELLDNSESNIYNCISFTIGKKDIISWPINELGYWPTKKELSKDSFDVFYDFHGFIKCSLDFSYDPDFIKVALFMSNGVPTHASLQVDNDWWESKIGSLGIIRHDLFQIEDNVYGEVVQIYKKPKFINEKILYFREYFISL